MSSVPHPYAIEVSPATKPAGHFQWALRRSGKLVERSDRTYESEVKAHSAALAALEREMTPSADTRRR